MVPRNWRVQAHYSAFYAAQFVLLGVQLPFLSGWLAREGFSAPEIGWLSGLSLGARLLFGPAVAFWADRGDNHARALRLISLLFGAGAVGLALLGGKPLIALSAVAVLWSFGLLVPLSDTAILRADRRGDLHYGEVRAAGSAAFLITNIAAGFVIARTSIDIAVVIMAAAGLATFLISATLPLEGAKPSSARGRGWRGEAEPGEGTSTSVAARVCAPSPPAPFPQAGEERGADRWREAATLMTTPAFLIFLATVGLIQGSHAAYYSFSILHWTALGYAATTIGFLWATGVVAEIFVLTRVRGLVRRLGPEALIVIGGAGGAARWLLTGLEPPLPLLFLIQTMHALSFAAAYLGAVEYVDRALPKRLTNTAMTLMSTTGVGAVTGLATIACGYLFEFGGAKAIYALTAAMAALGAAGGLMLKRRSARAAPD
jgi:MFS transporter, PPP family, 3-phenylpropionic acid transporter